MGDLDRQLLRNTVHESSHLAELLSVTFSNFKNIARSAFCVQTAYASLFIHVESKTWRKEAIRVLDRYGLVLLYEECAEGCRVATVGVAKSFQVALPAIAIMGIEEMSSAAQSVSSRKVTGIKSLEGMLRLFWASSNLRSKASTDLECQYCVQRLTNTSY